MKHCFCCHPATVRIFRGLCHLAAFSEGTQLSGVGTRLCSHFKPSRSHWNHQLRLQTQTEVFTDWCGQRESVFQSYNPVSYPLGWGICWFLTQDPSDHVLKAAHHQDVPCIQKMRWLPWCRFPGGISSHLCLLLVWSSTRESVCWRARQGACTVDSGSELAKTYARPHIGFLISKAFRILSIGHLFSIAVIQQCALAARDSLSCSEWMNSFKSGSWRGFILLEKQLETWSLQCHSWD